VVVIQGNIQIKGTLNITNSSVLISGTAYLGGSIIIDIQNTQYTQSSIIILNYTNHNDTFDNVQINANDACMTPQVVYAQSQMLIIFVHNNLCDDNNILAKIVPSVVVPILFILALVVGGVYFLCRMRKLEHNLGQLEVES